MSRESDKNMTFDEKCAQRKYMCDALIGNATPKVSFPRTPDLPDDLHGPMGYVPPRAPSQDIDAQKEMGMRNMRKYPKVVAEAMMDAEYEDSQLTEEERAAREEEKERVIEQKMREEIEAKQLASLTGKAHQKEWNYAMYENRKRRIPRNQVKPPLYESIERAAYEKFMEDEERRLRREALGLFD